MPTEPPHPDGFQQAVAKFSLRLSKKEFEDFKFCTLHDLRTAITTIQEVQGKRRELMNLTRVQAFLEAMDQYGKVIEVFLNASSILCFVWGPMKFILQASNSNAYQYKLVIHSCQRPPVIGPSRLIHFSMLISSSHKISLCWNSIRRFSRTARTCGVFCP
jgi:hypothetical protein